MLVIYAWNEFGEGKLVASTQGKKEMRLEDYGWYLAGERVGGTSIAGAGLIWRIVSVFCS